MENDNLNFDIHKMREICLADFDYFKNYAEEVETEGGAYYFKDNGANILAVAHLDFVPQNRFFNHEGDRVFCPQLDDRLGVYTILEELSKRGIVADILLTTNEEKCQSTARYFKTDKQYNWVIEFDRPSDGIAMNTYLDSEIKERMSTFGFKVDRIDAGLYTDIVELKKLGVKCFNFGVGYELLHTDQCYGDLNVLEEQLQCVKRFYDECKDEKLTHIDKPYVPYSGFRNKSYSNRDFLDLDKEDDYDFKRIMSDSGSVDFEEYEDAEELDQEVKLALKHIYIDYINRGYSAEKIHEMVVSSSESLSLYNSFKKDYYGV